MKQKKWIPWILLTTVLLCLTGCENEEFPESDKKEDNAPVDKKVEALVINTDDHSNTDNNEQDDSVQEDSAQEDSLEADEDKQDDSQEKPENEQNSPSVLEELNTQIEDFISEEQAKGTSVSVYAENLTTGDYAVSGSRQQQSASLIKLFIAGCVYEQPDILKAQEAYENETEELMRQMITISDNDATNTLITRLGSGDAAAGMACINEYCKKHNFPDTHMGRLMLDFNAADDNYTSVTDCGHFLSAIYKKQLTGSENILSYMKQQERTGKIPAGIPDGVETANKTGELTDVENDAAIIFSSQGPYTLCVILNQLADPAAGRTMITGLSAMVYNYMAEQTQ